MTRYRGFDICTGLPDYYGFAICLGRRLRAGGSFYVTHWDLHGLRAVNDGRGHFLGDDGLRAFGHGLRDRLGADVAGRTHASEFMLITDDVSTAESDARWAEQRAKEVDPHFWVKCEGVISASGSTRADLLSLLHELRLSEDPNLLEHAWAEHRLEDLDRTGRQ